MSLSCMADIFRQQGVVAAEFLAALNDQQVLVVEGLGGWLGRQKSDSQVFCHAN